MSKEPFIAITSAHNYSENMFYLKEGYSEAVLEAGGMPAILMPVRNERFIREYVERFDGFIFSGGPDLDASHYGEENLKFNGTIEPDRDEFELKLIRYVIEANKPALGICRGCQLLNVALGGTLYQDIFSQIDKTLIRHAQDAPRWHKIHKVFINKGSHLMEIFKEESIGVNSYHHQAIKDVGKGCTVTSMASDGIIESIELSEKDFVVGVQWHPEGMWQQHPQMLKLFQKFVEFCKKYK